MVPHPLCSILPQSDLCLASLGTLLENYQADFILRLACRLTAFGAEKAGYSQH